MTEVGDWFPVHQPHWTIEKVKSDCELPLPLRLVDEGLSSWLLGLVACHFLVYKWDTYFLISSYERKLRMTIGPYERNRRGLGQKESYKPNWGRRRSFGRHLWVLDVKPPKERGYRGVPNGGVTWVYWTDDNTQRTNRYLKKEVDLQGRDTSPMETMREYGCRVRVRTMFLYTYLRRFKTFY